MRLCRSAADSGRHEELRNGRLTLLPLHTAHFQNMIRALMHPDAAKRPSAAQVLKHPLLTKTKSATTQAHRALGAVPSQPSQLPTPASSAPSVHTTTHV